MATIVWVLVVVVVVGLSLGAYFTATIDDLLSSLYIFGVSCKAGH